MRKLPFTLLVSIIVLFALPPVSYSTHTIIQLTTDFNDDHYPRLNDNGEVVWIKHDGTDWELFLWRDGTTTQITHNDYDDYHHQINESGLIVWEGIGELNWDIFLYDGGNIFNISPTLEDEDHNPQINNNGEVVWTGWDGDKEIFFWDGNFPVENHVIQITNNVYPNYDAYPQINDSREVIYVSWEDGDVLTMNLFFWDGTLPEPPYPPVPPYPFPPPESIIQLTDTPVSSMEPQINNNRGVVWGEHDGSNIDIFFWDGTLPIPPETLPPTDSICQLTDNPDHDHGYQISDSRCVVWYGYDDGSDQEIFLWDGTLCVQPNPFPSPESISQLTNNDYTDVHPQINDYCEVVWEGRDGLANMIFLYDGTTITQISPDSYRDSAWGYPQINNNGDIVWYGYLEGEGSDDEIFLAISCDRDRDGYDNSDGYYGVSCGGDDCDDKDPNVNPAMTEIPNNGIDDDCDPSTPDQPPWGAAKSAEASQLAGGNPEESVILNNLTTILLPVGLVLLVRASKRIRRRNDHVEKE